MISSLEEVLDLGLKVIAVVLDGLPYQPLSIVVQDVEVNLLLRVLVLVPHV